MYTGDESQKFSGKEISIQSKAILFYKRMPEKTLKVELFLLEEDPYFSNLELKGKIVRTISKYSQELKNWYVEQ